MKLEALIAVRYIFARRGRSVANTISWVSLVGLTVSTAALVVVLSVYNGIGRLTMSLFSTFDPELIIQPTEGKTFRMAQLESIAPDELSKATTISQIAEETAWVTYGSEQAIATLRGVDEDYTQICHLDTMIVQGFYRTDGLVVGGELWYQLGMNLHSNQAAALHIPRRGSSQMGLTMDEAFRTAYAMPVANFFIQQDIDQRYIVTDIATVRQLMDYADDECTAVALQLPKQSDIATTKRRLNEAFANAGATLQALDRYDQQPLYLKIFRTERLGIYLVLSIIILISTLSLSASLSLLIIDKRADIFALRSMGMTRSRVRRAFAAEGWLICGVAVVAGLAVGFVICWLQQTFGLIRMGDGNFVVSAFPVAMRAIDFGITFLLVMALSGLTVVLTVRRARL